MNPFQINLHKHNEYVSNYIRKNKVWEPQTTEILLEIIRDSHPNTIFIDIGANIGWFSLTAASQGMKCLSFEPVKENWELFQKSIEKNNFQDLITLYNIALGNSTGLIAINVALINMGLCSQRTLLKEDYSHSVICKVDKLDNILVDNKYPLIIKIDVELDELKVLQGMESILESGLVTHIIIEISKYDQEYYNIMLKHGFTKAIEIGHNYGKQFKTTIDITSYIRSNKYTYSTGDMSKIMSRQDYQAIILFFR